MLLRLSSFFPPYLLGVVFLQCPFFIESHLTVKPISSRRLRSVILYTWISNTEELEAEFYSFSKNTLVSGSSVGAGGIT